MKKYSCKIRWAVKIVIIPCAVSINGEELVVISGYGHFGCCFYVYCFVWLILVNVPMLIMYYLAIVDLHSIWYLSNPSNYFNATMSNDLNIVFSMGKSLWVLQKASIKIVTCAVYTYLFFSYTYILLYCWKIKHCDHCSYIYYDYIYIYYEYILLRPLLSV